MLPALETGRADGITFTSALRYSLQERSEKQITQDSAMGWSLVLTLHQEVDSRLQLERSLGLFMACVPPSSIIFAISIQKALFCSKEEGEIFENGKVKPAVLVVVASAAHNAGLCADSQEKSVCAYLNGNRKEMLCPLTRAGTFRDQLPKCM